MGQDDKTTKTATEAERIAELQKRIDAAKVAKEAADEKRLKKFALADKERELEQAERAAKEAEVLDELECEHGRLGEHLWKVDTTIGMVVLKRPTPAKYRSFVDSKKINQNAQEQFVREFLVYPGKVEFNAMVGQMPALINRCSDALIYLAGYREREEAMGN
jgi:hypothetical protein